MWVRVYYILHLISIRVWGIASFIRLGFATTFYIISETTSHFLFV